MPSPPYLEDSEKKGKSMFLFRKKTEMTTPAKALPGRAEALPTATLHHVIKTPLKGPYPAGSQQIVFGMGCFWGAERIFWQLGAGIITTAVGYAAGFTLNPTYEEVCSGQTGHNEVVLVVFDPAILSRERILQVFWENHDPTQGMRQGNDVGTQYRSGIYTSDALQHAAAIASRDMFQSALDKARMGAITTEILDAPAFYFAEAYHQQYLAKNPGGYCGLGGTGVSCPIGVARVSNA
jgi:peptide-methionine (S)-S-oxide reductase